jgi:hypothetical protein
MKALIILTLLLLPLLGWGQIYRLDPTTHKIAYSEVTEVEGTPQAELYDRARKWFDLQFAHTESVTMSEHQEEGELHIQAELPLKVGLGGSIVSYTLILSLKEGKYRYLISNFTYRHPDNQPLAFEHHRLHPRMQIYAKTDEKMHVLIGGLHQKMIRKITASVTDW